MDESRSGQEAATSPVPKPRLIGFIGRATVTDYETAALTYIGKCIATIGHALLVTTRTGAAGAVGVGVEAQRGYVKTIPGGIIDVADRTLIYPDLRLLERIENTYKDIYERQDVVIIYEHQLGEWLTAMKDTVTGYGLDLP
jgi:hypothetical protein